MANNGVAAAAAAALSSSSLRQLKHTQAQNQSRNEHTLEANV